MIGIILVLATLLLSVGRRAWAQSRFALCASQLRQQVQAHLAYAADYNDVKPPLWLQKATRADKDYVSPDVKWFGRHVGQGLLVKGKYLDFKTLLDPSESMARDVERDTERWAGEPPHSGSSYVYFWRSPPPDGVKLTGAMTYQKCQQAGEMALVMDLNAERRYDGGYEGEYEGRWMNHPVVRRWNVGYLDGSVRGLPVTEAILRRPGEPYEELEWIRRINRLR